MHPRARRGVVGSGFDSSGEDALANLSLSRQTRTQTAESLSESSDEQTSDPGGVFVTNVNVPSQDGMVSLAKLAGNVRALDLNQGKRRGLTHSSSMTSARGKDTHERSSSISISASRRGSRMLGTGSRININIQDLAPSVRSTFYVTGRPPPLKIDMKKFIERVIKIMSLPPKPPGFPDIFQKHLLEKESIEICRDMFWLVHCLFFQCESEHHQQLLVESLSSKFIQMFMPLQHRDTFMQYYPFALAYSICNCFIETFASDKGLFGADFRRDIVHISELLYSGVRFSDAYIGEIEQQIFAGKMSATGSNDLPFIGDTNARPRRRNSDTSSSSNIDLSWVQDHIAKMDQGAPPRSAPEKLDVLDEAVAVNRLLFEQKMPEDMVPKKKPHKQMPLSHMRQLSPLVHDYLVGQKRGNARAILKDIHDMLEARHNANKIAREEIDKPETVADRQRGEVNPVEDAKKRQVYFKRLHEGYVRSKVSCSRDIGQIHRELKEGFRNLEESKQRVLKGGEASVSHLTMKIMEHQQRRKEVVQRNLQKMGYIMPSDPKNPGNASASDYDVTAWKHLTE